MSDLIELKKTNGKVMAVSVILKNRPNSEVLEYVKNFEPTTDFESAGFDKPLLGIGGKGTCFLDNSDKFFGKVENGGIVMISPSKDDMESWGDELYLDYYDGEHFFDEKIFFEDE